jgi:hypothetical protein
MRTKSMKFFWVLAALSIGGTAASVGCSGTATNSETGGAGGKTSGSGQGGTGNGSSGGNGGEGNGFIPSSGAGANDGGLDPDSACAAQSAAATLEKKPVDIIIVVDNSGSMTEEIEGVQNNITKNFAQILDQSGLDYRVILIGNHGSAANGQSICIEAPLSGIPAGGCSSPPAEAVDNPGKFYHYDDEINSVNAWCKLLTNFSLPDDSGAAGKVPNGWQTWLREDSFKAFIVLTDDHALCTYNGVNFDDNDNAASGQTSAAAFDSALLALSPLHFGTAEARNYKFYSIVAMDYNTPMNAPWLPADPIVTAECPTAYAPGTGYQALSILTDSLRFPLCDTTSYDVVFKAIADGVIAGSKVACDFPVPAPPMGQAVDLDTVQVQYTPTGMGAPTNLKKVADLASCAPDSFYLDVATKQVYLCPDTCVVVQKDDKAKIDVLFACEIGGAN